MELNLLNEFQYICASLINANTNKKLQNSVKKIYTQISTSIGNSKHYVLR